MNKAEMLTALCHHTGLSRATVKELIKLGWSYSETNGQPTFRKGGK